MKSKFTLSGFILSRVLYLFLIVILWIWGFFIVFDVMMRFFSSFLVFPKILLVFLVLVSDLFDFTVLRIRRVIIIGIIWLFHFWFIDINFSIPPIWFFHYWSPLLFVDILHGFFILLRCNNENFMFRFFLFHNFHYLWFFFALKI